MTIELTLGEKARTHDVTKTALPLDQAWGDSPPDIENIPGALSEEKSADTKIQNQAHQKRKKIIAVGGLFLIGTATALGIIYRLAKNREREITIDEVK